MTYTEWSMNHDAEEQAERDAATLYCENCGDPYGVACHPFFDCDAATHDCDDDCRSNGCPR